MGVLRDNSKKSDLPSIDDFLPVRARRNPLSKLDSSGFSSDLLTRTSTPPMRKAESSTAVGRTPHRPSETSNLQRNDRLTTEARESVKHLDQTTDDEEIWAKAQMARDEKQADEVREGFLIGRCWHVWRSSLQWFKASGTFR